jgi:leucine-rich PPR motif-containing protein
LAEEEDAGAAQVASSSRAIRKSDTTILMQFLSLPTASSPTPRLFKPVASSASFRRPSPPTPPAPKPSLPPPPANPLASKLWLTSKLSPPPPTPPPEPEPLRQEEFRQKGKVFVGNLPLWARKPEIAEFFRQFGPLEKVELVRGHDDPERNVGFCFLYYGGDDPEAAAARAVEVDGVEFRGKSLTVRLDDGRKGRARAEERARWVEAGVAREARSPWHKGREDACRQFRRVLESRPEDWQAVVSAFERIPKVVASLIDHLSISITRPY